MAWCIDDGVAGRLSENHFYVTATTSRGRPHLPANAEMECAVALNVDIANVTSAFAAVNIAGPNSRKVLQKVCQDVDFSAAAFPYLGLRTGTIQGIAVRILRVGFVGELGYEIHFPARYGEFMWDLLMQAGQEFSMKPFGCGKPATTAFGKGSYHYQSGYRWHVAS